MRKNQAVLNGRNRARPQSFEAGRLYKLSGIGVHRTIAGPSRQAGSKYLLSLGPTKEVAMHAGNIRTEQQANCVLVFALLLEQDIIPLLQQQKGFQDKIIPIAGKRNEAIVIVYRVSEENADAYNHVLYLDALRTLSRVVESVPVVEPFEVVDSRFNGTAAGAA